jgi:hypothetical protein
VMDAPERRKVQRLYPWCTFHATLARYFVTAKLPADPAPGRPKPDQPPRGAATREAVERGG